MEIGKTMNKETHKKSRFTSEEHQLISEAIAHAEKVASVEIVPAVVTESDLYREAQYRVAIFSSLSIGILFYLFAPYHIHPIWYFLIQIPGLFMGFYLSRIQFVKKLFMSKHEIEEEVSQRAYQLFFEHGLHLTRQRNGLLIFISLLEQKIKIVSDQDLKQKISQDIWNELIDHFADHMQNETLAQAIAKVIHDASAVLERHRPKTAASKNEIANHIIEE